MTTIQWALLGILVALLLTPLLVLLVVASARDTSWRGLKMRSTEYVTADLGIVHPGGRLVYATLTPGNGLWHAQVENFDAAGHSSTTVFAAGGRELTDDEAYVRADEWLDAWGKAYSKRGHA